MIGVDLSTDAVGDGMTPNDANGHEDGPDHWQNYPVLTSVMPTQDGQITVSGTLSSPNMPKAQATILLYANDGGAQGRSRFGAGTVTLDDHGVAAFELGPFPAPAGQRTITAIATTSNGSSEFSAPLGPADLLFANEFE